jgi:hypothetical protein
MVEKKMIVNKGAHGWVYVGDKPVAEIKSWNASVTDELPPIESYEFTGTFKMSLWQRMKFRKFIRKMLPKKSQPVKIRFHATDVQAIAEEEENENHNR